MAGLLWEFLMLSKTLCAWGGVWVWRSRMCQRPRLPPRLWNLDHYPQHPDISCLCIHDFQHKFFRTSVCYIRQPALLHGHWWVPGRKTCLQQGCSLRRSCGSVLIPDRNCSDMFRIAWTPLGVSIAPARPGFRTTTWCLAARILTSEWIYFDRLLCCENNQ